MRQVVCITLPDAQYGFHLAGITQYAVALPEAEDAISKATDEPETGLVIVDERIVKSLTEERLREIQRRWSGILLVLPSPEKPSADEEDYALRLIRRAIGYHVRVRV